MHCPEHKVLNVGSLWAWLYWHDVPRHLIPLRVWLNLLRYEVSIRIFGRRFVWNREGMLYPRLTWKWAKFRGRA